MSFYNERVEMIERLKEVYKAKLAAEIAERKADISEHLRVIFGLELALSMFETACCEVAVEESSNKLATRVHNLLNAMRAE